MKVKVTQSCPTLCDPMDCTVHGILQARKWEWLPCPSSGDLPKPGTEPRSPTLQADTLPPEPQGKRKNTGAGNLSLLQGNLTNPAIEPGSLVLQADSLITQSVKNLPVMWETWVRYLGWEDSLGAEKGYPLQYSGLDNSMESQRVGHDWVTFTMR